MFFVAATIFIGRNFLRFQYKVSICNKNQCIEERKKNAQVGNAKHIILMGPEETLFFKWKTNVLEFIFERGED